MATRNTTESGRFLYRESSKEPEPYFVPMNKYGSVISQSSTVPHVPTPPKIIRSADMVTPRTEITNPARRIVVIRNTKHPQFDQEPADLDNFGRSDSLDVPLTISDGHKSVFLIRRQIALPEPPKSVESYRPVQEPPPTNTLERIHTPTSPEQIVPSSDPTRSPSPHHSPPIRPQSSKRPRSSTRPENSQHHALNLKRPRSIPRTPSPVRTNSTRQSRSPPPPPPKQEEPKEITRKRSLLSFFSKKGTTESTRSPSPVIIENDQQTEQYRPVSRIKSGRRKKSTSSRVKSAKSVVLTNFDDQSVAVVENAYVKGEPLRPALKRPKSLKKTRFQDEINDESTEKLINRSRSQRCLSCLSRHMCLIIIICFILILIGLAGVGVSAYFLATASSTNPIPKIVGIVVGGVLAIAAFCFLYILLGCIGARDGYFTYNDDGPHKGGRAFAVIPPTHPNADSYVPRDYMKVAENSHPPPSVSVSNPVHRQSSFMQPVSATSYNQQSILHRTNTSINGYENKSNKNNIIIEMPERLLTGRQMSPRSRERSFNKVVKNIGHVVEDAKKRYNGDVPNKVIVKVDKNAMQTA